MRPPFSARDTGITPSGSRYVILQDSPFSFHITISNQAHNKDLSIYDCFTNPSSKEDLFDKIYLLEKELLMT